MSRSHPTMRPYLLLGLLALVLGGCRQTPPLKPFSYRIDAGIATDLPSSRPSAKGERPLAVVQDEQGVRSVFVANEVVLEPANQQQLDAFLARYGGTVIEDDSVPAPPAGLALQIDQAETAASEYVVRLDPSSFPLDTIAADAEAAGFGGDRVISSEGAARLLALIWRERRNGLAASPNYALFPTGGVLDSTDEVGLRDAFAWPQLHFASDMTGSKSGVLQAWQLLYAHGISRRVNVAIIDGGFWLDNQGRPGALASVGISDLPDLPAQYDFDGDDYRAGGSNPASCTGGNPCPWHGNNSASVATARADNFYGSVGTGGTVVGPGDARPVAEPILFKTDLTRSQVRRAVKTAVAWGADVVSMSFGGSCNLDCWSFLSSTFTAFVDAQQKGLILLAAAGNDNKNVDNDPVWPCMVTGMICVGALDDGGNTRISYSNYGASVDIFAPTNIPSMPNPGTQPSLDVAGGTSASTPFVAGVAALMKALDPTLTQAQVESILRSTAWTDSPDSRVPRYLNAFAAVREVIGNDLPDDPFEPDDSQGQSRAIASNTLYDDLTLSNGYDFDYYRYTLDDYAAVDIDLTFMPGLGNVLYTPIGDGPPPLGQTVTQRVDGKLVHHDLLPPGQHTLLISGPLNHYHLNVKATPSSPAPDAFEVNDTLGTAALPAEGSYDATFHTASDVDFYAFSASLGPIVSTFVFQVDFSDKPVTLELYQNGSLLTSTAPGTNPKITVSTSGNYTVKVISGATNRYVFHLGAQVNKDLFVFPVPVDDFWFIDPTGPIRRWLVGQREAFGLTQTSDQLVEFSGLELFGDDLHLSLYAADGTLLADGQPFVNSDGVPGELLPFAGTVADENYLLLLERTTVPDDPAALLPAVAYDLNWASR